MSNKIIRAELETKLKAWADSQNPVIPVSFQNVSFKKPPNNTPFVECFLIPNENFQIELSLKRTTMIGRFQVNCWVPIGAGMGLVETITEGIISTFKPLPKTGTVSIEGKPFARPSVIDESGYMVVPVVIKYRFESI